MADNIELDAGSGGATVAADDVGGVHFQVVKLDVGGDGVSAPVSNSNPVPVSDAGGTLTVDGTVTANLGATDNAVLDAIQAATEATQAAVEGTLTVGSHAVTNAGTFATQAAQSGTWTVDLGATDNAVLDAIAASVAGTLTVGSHAVTNAGTFAVQSASAGVAADDAATSGNPVLIGGVAVETDGTDPTTVSAEGDAAYLRTDRARRLLVNKAHPRGFFTSADYSGAQTNTTVQAAPGAGLSLYITDIVISNGATAGNITLLDGSGGTVKFEIYPAINGGVSLALNQPIRLTANTLLAITSTTVTTHSVNVGGYIAP